MATTPREYPTFEMVRRAEELVPDLLAHGIEDNDGNRFGLVMDLANVRDDELPETTDEQQLAISEMVDGAFALGIAVGLRLKPAAFASSACSSRRTR